MNISVVLCTHNRAETLGVTLHSLAEQRIPAGLEWEVIVVDNNSTDGTRGVVEQSRSYLPSKYVFEPRQGKSFAVNASIPLVDGSDMIVFTDDDVTMDPGWIAGLWRAFASQEWEALGGRIVPVWSCAKPRWYGDQGPFALMAGVVVDYDHGDDDQQVRTVAMMPYGANMAFRKGAFAKHGQFNTGLGPTGKRLMRGEDTDFCMRIRDAGGKILYVGDAIVYHPVDSHRVRKSYFQSWYYYYGRKQIRTEPNKLTDKLWLGAPRYLYLDMVKAAFKWATTFEPKERFFHRLQCWRISGAIAEYRDPTGLT